MTELSPGRLGLRPEGREGPHSRRALFETGSGESRGAGEPGDTRTLAVRAAAARVAATRAAATRATAGGGGIAKGKRGTATKLVESGGGEVGDELQSNRNHSVPTRCISADGSCYTTTYALQHARPKRARATQLYILLGLYRRGGGGVYLFMYLNLLP